jgi:hypothetical protein
VLAAGADRDVAEVRAELRAHTGTLNALRADQIDLREEMRRGFATANASLFSVVGGDQDVGPGAGTGVVERVRERFLDDAVGHQLHALVEGVQFAAGSVDDLRAGRAGSSPPRPGAGRAGWSAPVRRSATSPSSPEATALPSRSAGSAAVRVRFGEGECPHHCHQVRVRHRQLNATLVIGRVEQGLAAQVQQIENDEPVVDVGLERLGAADRAAELVA